jgi:hypothetical protein
MYFKRHDPLNPTLGATYNHYQTSMTRKNGGQFFSTLIFAGPPETLVRKAQTCTNRSPVCLGPWKTQRNPPVLAS